MTEQSEIRQSIDYLVTRIARDYQKDRIQRKLESPDSVRSKG